MKPGFPWGVYLRAFAIGALLALAPVIPVAMAGGIASLNGCPLTEANIHPCVVLGVDLGGVLYGMGVMGWMMLLTLPTGRWPGSSGWWLCWVICCGTTCAASVPKLTQGSAMRGKEQRSGVLADA